RHTRFSRDWSSDVCSSDLAGRPLSSLSIRPRAHAMSRSAPKLSKVDLSLRLPDAETYQDRLKDLQTRLQRLQSACYHNRQRAVIVLEGWDAAGKGGAIRRMTEKLDPRSYRVHAIGAPND